MQNLIFLADARGMAFNIIRNFLVFLDSAIYTLMGWILEAIFNISGTELLKATVYETIMQRIYVILGIFMLFKLSISLIGYLVNPDSIADKEKGMGKVVMRAMLMIIMLMMLTPFFKIMTRVQGYILPVIPKVILGKDMETGGATAAATAKTVGEEMAIVTYRAFFKLDETCTDGGSDDTRIPGMTVSEISKQDLEQEPCGKNEDLYKYDYLPIVPLVVGIVIDLLLVGFAIDIGSRVFKLAILRVIAPIPILSYIDPKSSKDNGTFNNWLKSFMGTWLDLFIKLAIIYFVLFVIEIIAEGELVGLDITTPAGAFASIFVIIGLLFFAKQAPAFIMNALGIKGKGLGVGLSGSLAGLAALTGGAGVAGAFRAAGEQMEAGSAAAAEGKPVGSGWSRGKDIAAQIRTNDDKAKAPTMMERVSKAGALFHGVNSDTVGETKNSMYRAQDAAANVTQFREKVSNGQTLTTTEAMSVIKHSGESVRNSAGIDSTTWSTMSDSQKINTVNSMSGDQWNTLVNTENTNAQKAKSYYEKTVKYAVKHNVSTETPVAEDIGVKGFNKKFDPHKHDR